MTKIVRIILLIFVLLCNFCFTGCSKGDAFVYLLVTLPQAISDKDKLEGEGYAYEEVNIKGNCFVLLKTELSAIDGEKEKNNISKLGYFCFVKKVQVEGKLFSFLEDIEEAYSKSDLLIILKKWKLNTEKKLKPNAAINRGVYLAILDEIEDFSVKINYKNLKWLKTEILVRVGVVILQNFG